LCYYIENLFQAGSDQPKDIMNKSVCSNIVLIGFSTTGKSQVAIGVAQLLGWDFIDTDSEIVKLAGKEIPQIFSEDGEEYFRRLESQLVQQACSRENIVIASGGGAVLDPQNQEMMTSNGVVVLLEAKPETIYERLVQDRERSGGVRPLLEVADPLDRIRSLKASRLPYYAIADWTVHTDNLTIPEVCREVVRGWQHCQQPSSQAGLDISIDLACRVTTETDSYPIYVNWGLLDHLGQLLHQAGLGGNIFVISDDIVKALHGDQADRSLRESGFETRSFVVPAGEATKILETAATIYDWLVENHAERRDIVLALGGGMVGDLAGFAAATFLRGMPLVQVPTTLVAMVDASIGGKTAVNHPKAKNLIGSFYQPCLVAEDVQTLTTLPSRELTSGWAEVIKHALILDAEEIKFLESNAHELKELEPQIITRAIRCSAAIKARIVGEDEKERGRRTLLNYGHTIAHGLEAATGYERFLHGEAVAIGMMAAANISHRLGLLSSEEVETQRALLEEFDLPTQCHDVDSRAVITAMELDKKVSSKTIRWVLLTGLGEAAIRADVPPKTVQEIVGELLGN
jgi:shikimate kinase/3-dehydroquinate synthase